MKTITVNVTARDIERGVPDRVAGCPIFRAISRKRKDGIAVYRSSVLFPGQRAELPPEAQIFIGRFDEGWVVKPFKFRLEIE